MLIGTILNERYLDLDLDGFVFGNKKYAVRLTASFDIEKYESLVSKIHNLGKKAYVYVNKLFTQFELEGLEEHLIYLHKIKVDGIYFSDMAVYQIAKRNEFENILIYHPDTLSVNSKDALIMKELNVASVVLSKDITLENILEIGDKVPSYLTLFSYGHFPLFYSKRKLIKNYFDYYEKDAEKYIENKNLTARELTRNELYPIYQDDNGTIIYSDKKLDYSNYLFEINNHHINTFFMDFIFDDFENAKEKIKLYRRSILNKNDQPINDDKYTLGYLFKKTNLK